MSNKEDFHDFKAMTEKTDFDPITLSLFRVNKKLFEGSLQRLYVINIPLQFHKKTSLKMEGILHDNTYIKTYSNLNNT